MREENFAERRGKEGTIYKILPAFHKLSLVFKYFVQERFSNHQWCHSVWFIFILTKKTLKSPESWWIVLL